MAAAALPIASSLPPEYNVDEPQTSSAFVLRRNYVELLPNEQIEFQPQSGQDMIRFIINDQSSFWAAAQSYFRFRFKAVDDAGAAISKLRLGAIGFDSLFRMIELRSVSSGTVLMRQNFYNHGTMAQQYYFRPDEFAIGDGYDTRAQNYKQPRMTETLIRIPETGTVHTAAAVGGSAGSVLIDQQVLVTLNRVNGLGLINVGDVLCFEMTSYVLGGISSATATELAIGAAEYVSAASIAATNASAGAVTVDTTTLYAASNRHHEMVVETVSVSATGVITLVTGRMLTGDVSTTVTTARHVYVRQMNKHKTQAAYVCDGQYHTVCWQPMNSVFWQNWPLFLFKGGLELVLYLENPRVALVQDINPGVASSTGVTYKILSPRLVALMSTPEPSIQRDFIGKWNSDQGIVYYCPQLETRKIQGNAADNDMVINVPFGKRSIRNLMLNIVPSDIANGNGALGLVGDAFRSNIRSHMRYLWIQVAANYFPARRIEVDDEGNEILWQTKNALTSPFSMNTVLDQEKWAHRRFENADCYYWTTVSTSGLATAGGVHWINSANTLLNKKFECRDRIYVVNFARTDGKGGILSGIDGSISSVDIMIDRDGNNYSGGYKISESRTGEVLNTPSGTLGDPADTGEAQWGDAPVYFAHAYFDHFINVSARSVLVLN